MTDQQFQDILANLEPIRSACAQLPSAPEQVESLLPLSPAQQQFVWQKADRLFRNAAIEGWQVANVEFSGALSAAP
jgi:hypothetical protein